MKKCLVVLIACVFALWNAASASVSVRMDEGTLLLRENGEEIVPLGVYADIVNLGNGWFAAGQDGAYLLMNDQGQIETGTLYSDFRWAGDTLLACRDGLWTILDAAGQEVCDALYTRIVGDAGGYFWALKGNEGRLNAETLYLLSADGTEVETQLQISRMADAGGEGMLAALLAESGMWGYVNAQGTLAIPARYSYAGAFVSGCAVVVQDGCYGAIDAQGEALVDAEYDALEISDAGFLVASRTGEGVYLLDLKGEQLAFFEGEECYAAVVGSGFTIYDGRELRLFDAAGNLLETISRKGSFYEGLNGQWIISDGAWGEECVYLSGTQTRYQNLYPLGEFEGEALYVCMQANVSRYASDQLGEIQLAVDAESVRYGVVNAEGEMQIPCDYERIESIGDGRLLLYAGGLWQMTDVRGETLWSWGSIQNEEPSS